MVRSHDGTKLFDLEGLRGACACAVVACHLGFGGLVSYQGGIVDYALALASPFGFGAVMVFFILSGFVIGRTTQYPPTRYHVTNYLLKRFVRLYPIYIVALIVSFLVAKQPLTSAYFVVHAAFLQNLLPSVSVIASNGPLWSLSDEVFYYLAYVAIWLVPRSLYAMLTLAAAGVIAAALHNSIYAELFGLFGFWLFGLLVSRDSPLLSKIVLPTDSARFWLPLFLLLANMSTGAPAAILRHFGLNSGLLAVSVNCGLICDIFLSVLGKKLARPVAVPLYLLSLATTFVGLGFAFYAGKFGSMPSYVVALTYSVCALVAGAFRFKAPSRAAWSFIAPLGGISYGLYVIHMPIMYAAREVFSGRWIAIFFAVAIAFALAYLLEAVMQPHIRRGFFWLLDQFGVNRTRLPTAPLPVATHPTTES